MSTFKISDGQIIREYEEQGTMTVHCIPIEALASRMALLGVSDPRIALDAILQEQYLSITDNPYENVYKALGENVDPSQAQREALEYLPPRLGPDTKDISGIKEMLPEIMDDINAALEKFYRTNTPNYGD